MHFLPVFPFTWVIWDKDVIAGVLADTSGDPENGRMSGCEDKAKSQT